MSARPLLLAGAALAWLWCMCVLLRHPVRRAPQRMLRRFALLATLGRYQIGIGLVLVREVGYGAR